MSGSFDEIDHSQPNHNDQRRKQENEIGSPSHTFEFMPSKLTFKKKLAALFDFRSWTLPMEEWMENYRQRRSHQYWRIKN